MKSTLLLPTNLANYSVTTNVGITDYHLCVIGYLHVERPLFREANFRFESEALSW